VLRESLAIFAFTPFIFPQPTLSLQRNFAEKIATIAKESLTKAVLRVPTGFVRYQPKLAANLPALAHSGRFSARVISAVT
jgi:hypothetical protein